jgi:hypothetical protein
MSQLAFIRRTMIYLGLILLASLSVYTCAADRPITANSTAPMVVSYLRLPGYDEPYAYRYELVTQLLEITRAEFGDYQLAPYQMPVTSERYAKLISEGAYLNMNWASPGTPIASAEVIEIPIDILKGLLGYRVCLINRNSATDFSLIKDLHSLEGIKIGQAPWPDRAIYHANQLATVDAPYFDNLFMMLSAQRFDCIALGADEVVRVFDAQQAKYPFLAIDTHLLIHYDYPLYFYVSKQHPLLAQRLALGLQRMQHSGALDQLFYQFHAKNLARLQLQTRNLVCLTSPYQVAKPACVLPRVSAP